MGPQIHYPNLGKRRRQFMLHALPLGERPVERMLYVGSSSVALTELLAAVVGGPRQVEIAQELLERFGDLPGLTRASWSELADIPGVGRTRAARLQAALELGRRTILASAGDSPRIRSPADAALLLMPELACQEQEHFAVLFLNTRNRLLGRELVYKGNVSECRVWAGDVFREAVRRNCPAIIVAHTHPSGDPSPSPSDVEITAELARAGDVLGIELLDHLIIGQQRWVSLRERGLGFSG